MQTQPKIKSLNNNKLKKLEYPTKSQGRPFSKTISNKKEIEPNKNNNLYKNEFSKKNNYKRNQSAKPRNPPLKNLKKNNNKNNPEYIINLFMKEKNNINIANNQENIRLLQKKVKKNHNQVI